MGGKTCAGSLGGDAGGIQNWKWGRGEGPVTTEGKKKEKEEGGGMTEKGGWVPPIGEISTSFPHMRRRWKHDLWGKTWKKEEGDSVFYFCLFS